MDADEQFIRVATLNLSRRNAHCEVGLDLASCLITFFRRSTRFIRYSQMDSIVQAFNAFVRIELQNTNILYLPADAAFCSVPISQLETVFDLYTIFSLSELGTNVKAPTHLEPPNFQILCNPLPTDENLRAAGRELGRIWLEIFSDTEFRTDFQECGIYPPSYWEQ